MSGYEHKQVEAKWQERWERQRVAEVDLKNAREKYYMLCLLYTSPSPRD